MFDTYGYSATPGPPYANLEVWLTTIEWQAAENAEAYWAFLRAAGFDSAQSIPADCLIPAPYLVLPSSINEANLNVSEWESLYLSTLEGMGHFYNVTLSGTAFCGTQAVQQWSWGGSVWGNLYVNATGFVYLNNGTSPVDYNGKALPTEELGNRSTWAIGDTNYGDKWYNGSEQLILMPTISTVSIPVGVRYEVPADNPIQIYAVQTGLDLWLTGNGSANGSIPTAISQGGLSAAAEPLGTLTAGDAIYLTSCQVGGTASGNCSVTVQTVNVTLVNITCPGPCQQSQQNGGTFGGLPNPFSWLAGLFSSLLGGGPLGAFFGSLLAGIVILAVILGLVYVVYRVATKKKGRGAAGQTVVVEGGRRLPCGAPLVLPRCPRGLLAGPRGRVPRLRRLVRGESGGSSFGVPLRAPRGGARLSRRRRCLVVPRIGPPRRRSRVHRNDPVRRRTCRQGPLRYGGRDCGGTYRERRPGPTCSSSSGSCSSSSLSWCSHSSPSLRRE